MGGAGFLLNDKLEDFILNISCSKKNYRYKAMKKKMTKKANKQKAPMRSDTLKQQENVFRVAYFFQTSWAGILQLLTESCFESRETFFEKHIFHFALRDAL